MKNNFKGEFILNVLWLRILRKIEITTIADLPEKIESIRVSLERIYGAKLNVEFSALPVRSLCPTEEFLEKDKLALILMKILNEGYRVPIITVRKGGSYYILDGHARDLKAKRMGLSRIRSVVLTPIMDIEYGIIRTINAVGLRSLDDISIVE